MDSVNKKRKKRNFKNFIGWPSNDGIKVFKEYIDKMRFLFFIYIIILLIYIILFGILQTPVTNLLSCLFGSGFGISFSASAFEDLIMFMFLTLAVTILSIKLSTKSLEDHEFDNRIRAIMNSSNVKNNYRVFDFLKAKISGLLAYNKLIIYEIHINDYYPDKETFFLTVKRVQIMTNMCKDRDFESLKQSISIKPDVDIDGNYGKVKLLTYIDPVTHSAINKPIIADTELRLIPKDGEEVTLDYTIKQDSEMGINLIYEVYSKIASPELPESWSFCAVSKYTTEIRFSIFNELKNSLNLKFDLKHSNAFNKETEICKDIIVTTSTPYSYTTETSLLPDEKLLYYVQINNPILLA